MLSLWRRFTIGPSMVVQVSLSQEDQQAFLVFQRNHDNIVKLLNSKALDIKDGCAVIHFDHDGNIRRIDRNDRIYDV